MKQYFFLAGLFSLACILQAQSPGKIKYSLPFQARMNLLWEQQQIPSRITLADIQTGQESFQIAWWRQVPLVNKEYSTILSTTPTVKNSLPLLVNESLLHYYRMSASMAGSNNAAILFGRPDARFGAIKF